MKGVAIVGATGSIGRSAFAVLRQAPERFRPVVVTAHRNREALKSIVDEWRPRLAILSEPADDGTVFTAKAQGRGGTAGTFQDGIEIGTEWRSGREALIEAVVRPDVDIVLNALVGAAGLELTLAALKAGKRVALANKESLVCGGPLVLEAARLGGGELIPVDSEHSAIFQCLQGSESSEVERLVLTASGGPFRLASGESLAAMRPEDALRHPTWDMGAKITIDSATLANKALEVIEAHFLFGIGYDRIAVVVHPQSIIHSMVEFVDGSVLAQMGVPTMEIPIAYALSYPERMPRRSRRFDPVAVGDLTFEAVREEAFPAFALGIRAGVTGGSFPAVYNAANEVAVAAFLAHRLGFSEIGGAIADALDRWSGDPVTEVEDVLHADRWAREATRTYIEQHALC